MELGLAMKQEHGLSMRRACRVLGLSTSAPYYRSRRRDDGPVIEAVSKHVADNPGHGFGLLYDSFRADRHPWGKSWLWRVYKQLKLNLPRRGKRRLPARIAQPLDIPERLNETWSADFMADALWSGRRFRTFNVIDGFSREALRIEIDTSLPSGRVIRALDELVELRGKPKRLRLDNGPELISHALAQWARDNLVELCFIQPGKPTQNALIERFNRTMRTEVLDRYIFNNMNEVRQMLEDWRHRYNHQRPHSALGGVPPARYAMANSHSSSTSE
jgi:putative transposase